METCQLLLYVEAVADRSENRTKPAHLLCEKSVVICNVKIWWYVQLTLGFKGLLSYAVMDLRDVNTRQ